MRAKRKLLRTLVRLRLASCAAIVVAISGTAHAQEARKQFDIPAEPLSAALNDLSRQGDVVVTGASRLIGSKSAPAIRGTYTPEEALRLLLVDSGLRARNGGGGGYVIEETPRASSTSNLPVPEQDVATSFADTDIVVTAQKRFERLIDTPQSVSVLSGESLAKSGMTQFRDFADTVPGLSFQSSGVGQTQIVLRGVSNNADVGPTVGVYVDEVPYGASSAFSKSISLALDVGLFDIDRIEILRGPQGTLYGASTMGGLIKYVTKRPDTNVFGVEEQAGISTTRHGGVNYNGSAAVNIPVSSEKLAVRASGFYSRDGGYIDNVALAEDDVNRSRVYGGRLDVLATPTEALSIRLTGFLQNIARSGVGTADYGFDRVPINGSLEQSQLVPEPFEQRFRLISGTIDYDFGPAKLTSVSSFQATKTHYTLDLSPSFVPLLGSLGFSVRAVGFDAGLSTDKFTQEVRLSSGDSNALEWVVGGFYTHEKSTNRQSLSLFDLSGQPIPVTVFDALIPSTYEEIAGFGDMTYHVTSKFDITGGVRYARNNQKYEQIGTGPLASSVPKRKSNEGVFTYLANARYRFGDRVTAYVRYATGYRPGGPNFAANDPVTGESIGKPTFSADHLQSYEVGLKAETPDRTFGIDGSLYYINWSNMQVNAIVGGFGVIANSTGGAHIKGAELSLTARPTADLTFTSGFAYQNSELAQDEPDLGGAKGDPLPNVPKFTVNVAGDYVMRSARLRPTVGATLRFVSDRVTSFDESTSAPQYRLPSYAAVDLRAGLTLGAVDARVFVRNVFDERGQLAAPVSSSSFTGPNYIAILQPRTIGLSLSTSL